MRLRGKKLGIIGFGRIGTAVAQRAKSFGIDVQFYDPNVISGTDKALGVTRCEVLDELLEDSDFISINASLTVSSLDLINDKSFNSMKDGVIVINTARGSIINTHAMIKHLKSGKINSAGLDVIQEEPIIDDFFLSCDDLILTAHSAFYSEESFQEMRVKSASMAKDFLLGLKLRNEIKIINE